MNKKTLMRREADKLWFIKLYQPTCEICGKQAVQVHHFFPKGGYGHLRYDLDNGISVCQGCHMEIHFKGNPSIIPKIIEKRGKKWYNKLKKKAYTKPKPSYATVGWYRNNINKLQ